MIKRINAAGVARRPAQETATPDRLILGNSRKSPSGRFGAHAAARFDKTHLVSVSRELFMRYKKVNFPPVLKRAISGAWLLRKPVAKQSAKGRPSAAPPRQDTMSCIPCILTPPASRPQHELSHWPPRLHPRAGPWRPRPAPPHPRTVAQE